MTIAHMTSAEFRALHGDTANALTGSKVRGKKSRTVTGPFHVACAACSEEFRTEAAMTRHGAPGHRRFHIPLDPPTTPKEKP